MKTLDVEGNDLIHYFPVFSAPIKAGLDVRLVKKRIKASLYPLKGPLNPLYRWREMIFVSRIWTLLEKKLLQKLSDISFVQIFQNKILFSKIVQAFFSLFSPFFEILYLKSILYALNYKNVSPNFAIKCYRKRTLSKHS